MFDVVCLFAVILGVVLFLYGANYYENVVGWSGVFLFVGGILAWVIIYVYGKIMKKTTAQNP
jgi:positive regulator of sigma E activity